MAKRKRSNGSTVKWLVHKRAICHECRFEDEGKFAESAANKHALETGHIPTLEVTYDIARSTETSS